jgi:hypothetical protein
MDLPWREKEKERVREKGRRRRKKEKEREIYVAVAVYTRGKIVRREDGFGRLPLQPDSH